MEAVSLTFDNFDFIIHPFQLTIMDRVIAVAKDTISVIDGSVCPARRQSVR